jgi:hypothetical protein
VIVDERNDDEVHVVVRSQRTRFANVLRVCAEGDLFGVVFAPLVWVLVLAFASRKPRAEFSVTRHEVKLIERGELFGWFSSERAWATESIGEFRKNRFGSTIYLRVPGQEVTDLMAYLDEEASERIGRAVELAFANFNRRAK